MHMRVARVALTLHRQVHSEHAEGKGGVQVKAKCNLCGEEKVSTCLLWTSAQQWVATLRWCPLAIAAGS